MKAFIDGRLPESASDSLSSHLEGCRDCLSSLEQFHAIAISDQHPLRSPHIDLEFGNESKLNELQGRLLEVTPTPSRADESTFIGHALSSLQSEITIPETIGDDRVLGILGEGGMGIVYEARHQQLNRDVAIKMVRPARFGQASAVNRFLVEAEAAARLDHRGIVPIYEMGMHDNSAYFTMPLLSGGNLAEVVKANQLTDHRMAARMLRDISLAVQHAHSRGLIHRDLKPGNILLNEAGDPLVADFGLAKALGSADNLTITGELLGTPAYMSPEQADGCASDLTIISDIYSLGAVLYFMLTGRAPFIGRDAVDVLRKLQDEEPTPLRDLVPGIDRDLETITLKCLSREPSERYSSAEDLASELNRYLDHQPILARPISRWAKARHWCLRNRMVTALSVLVLASMIAGTVVSTYYSVLAHRRLDTLSTTNASLTTAKSNALDAARDAEEKTVLATMHADLALHGFETILYDLQNTLVENPAALSQRRRLLTQIIKELERLPESSELRFRLQRCKATAPYSLAEVAMEGGDDEGLSGMTASRKFYQDAIVIYRKLHQADPDDFAINRDLAEALNEYGDTSADDRDWTGALALFQEAEPLYQQLMEHPFRADGSDRSASADVDWAENQILCGEALTELNNLEPARVYLLRGYAKLREMCSESPRSRLSGLALGRSLRRLGDWETRAKHPDQAEEWLKEFVNVINTLVSFYPLDIECLMENSTAFERMGNLQRSRGDLAAAKVSYLKSLDLAARLESASADSVLLMWDISFSYQKVAEICLAMGDLDEALAPAKKCSEIRLLFRRANRRADGSCRKCCTPKPCWRKFIDVARNGNSQSKHTARQLKD